MQKLVLVLLLVAGAVCIGIPITLGEQKCMIVYTVGQSQSVKINAKFPQIPDKLQQEYYEIYIKNSQTEQQVIERSLPGTYKRQLSLLPNVIYEICFKVKSERQFGKLFIQYTAENLFNLDQTQIKVPENLLKSGDFKVAYQDAIKLFKVTERFTELQKERKQSQSQTFVKTNQINSRLVYISIAQVGIILVAGVYQFFTLRGYLVGKQYI